MNAIIELININKTYKTGLKKPQSALKNVSFVVPEKSIFGFLGANGAGKTTAIKLIMELQFPTSGNIKIFNKTITQEAKSKIGFLPERPYFHENLSANELLDYHRSLFGNSLLSKCLLENDELLSMVGLPNTGDKKIRAFSKGMQQRIGLAIALVNNPELIILDEPMSGLDPLGRRDIRNLLLNLSQQGKTIFFSSHILSDIESICDQIAFLEKGELKYSGKTTDLTDSKSSRQEVVFSNIEEIKVKEIPILKNAVKIKSHWKIEIDVNHNETIQAILSLNGKIISIQEQHNSLERVLFGVKK